MKGNYRKTKVQLIDVDKFVVYRWLRKNGYGIKEAKELSENGQVIDFYGDLEKCLDFYDYLRSYIPHPSSARLIININEVYDTMGVMAAFVVTDDDAEEMEKYSNELNDEKQ